MGQSFTLFGGEDKKISQLPPKTTGFKDSDIAVANPNDADAYVGMAGAYMTLVANTLLLFLVTVVYPLSHYRLPENR